MNNNKPDKILLYSGGVSAFWTPDPEHKTFRRCSNCDYTHKMSNGPLPDTCPDCGYKMMKGKAASCYLDIAKLLQEDD